MADLSTTKAPIWVGWWFRGAALYGAVAILLSLLAPPPGDPLFFRAFAGTAFAFQIAFWIIGGDPVRHRALMPAGVVEKLGLVIPVALAAAAGTAGGQLVAAALVDAALGLGFVAAWATTPGR